MEQRRAATDLLSERLLLREAEDALRAHLPSSWTMRLEQMTGNPLGCPDGTMEVAAPDGARALVVIEAKQRLDPRDVSPVAERLGAYVADIDPGASAMVVAPFISRYAQDLLHKAGIGYLDTTGNILMQIDRPALYIRDVGASTNPRREDRPLQSLKGPAAGRGVRALCDFYPPFGIRELATRCTTPAPSISRAVAFLERETMVTRGQRGQVVDVRWDALIGRWTDDYGLVTSNRTATYIEPRGFDALARKLREVPWRYAVTGSLAAIRVAPVASPRLAVIFVDDREMAAQGLVLRQVDKGANVLLAEPFDPVVFDRMVTTDGVTYAALSQVAADLLTSPGRGPEEGEELLRWMGMNEDEWRRRL